MCERYDERLPLLAAGLLDGAAKRELRAHIASCPDCQAQLAEWEQISLGVREMAGARVAELPPLATPPQVASASRNGWLRGSTALQGLALLILSSAMLGLALWRGSPPGDASVPEPALVSQAVDHGLSQAVATRAKPVQRQRAVELSSNLASSEARLDAQSLASVAGLEYQGSVAPSEHSSRGGLRVVADSAPPLVATDLPPTPESSHEPEHESREPKDSNDRQPSKPTSTVAPSPLPLPSESPVPTEPTQDPYPAPPEDPSPTASPLPSAMPSPTATEIVPAAGTIAFGFVTSDGAPRGDIRLVAREIGGNDWTDAISGVDGRYALIFPDNAASDSSWTISVESNPFALRWLGRDPAGLPSPYHPDVLVFQPGAAAQAMNIELQQPEFDWPQLEGTVLRLDGSPASDAMVVAIAEGASEGRDWGPVAISDSDGFFDLRLPAGRYRLGVARSPDPGLGPGAYWRDALRLEDGEILDLAEGDRVEDLVLRLP